MENKTQTVEDRIEDILFKWGVTEMALEKGVGQVEVVNASLLKDLVDISNSQIQQSNEKYLKQQLEKDLDLCPICEKVIGQEHFGYEQEPQCPNMPSMPKDDSEFDVWYEKYGRRQATEISASSIGKNEYILEKIEQYKLERAKDNE